MGDFHVRKITDAADRSRMYRHAIEDIEVFEQMLKGGHFLRGNPKIGAEQELCLVDTQHEPSTLALDLLDDIADEHYTNELALFNLEINLDPLPLEGTCFSDMESELLRLLSLGRRKAAVRQAQILMTGILPTLKFRHLQFEYMTPIQRYQTLSNALLDLRGGAFQIYLQGVDELIMSLQSVLFEACNTSFQLHLQIDPDEFVQKHNWSQMISGPVLAACVNSPMLFGNELWAESRIALFKQSLDTRSAKKHLRKKLPRVYFGNRWLQHSAAELWKNDLMRFPLLLTSDDLIDNKKLFAKGMIPDLRAIRLHNGTTYTWNRLCYGPFLPKAHLRIECRYIPSGPSALDEMANFAFWIGLMNCPPEQGWDFWKNIDFKCAKDNFTRAARTGLGSVFCWFGKNIPAKQLILDTLLPMAEKGLSDRGVAESDIQKYLNIIELRVASEQTGAAWQVASFRNLAGRFGEAVANREIVRESIACQIENIPVHTWKPMHSAVYPTADVPKTVEHIMSKDIFSCHEEDSIDLVNSIMEWNNIHHLPIENELGDLVGLITDGMLQRLNGEANCAYAKDVMMRDFIAVKSTESLENTTDVMREQQISGLPVVFGRKLVGIVTERDLARV